MAKKKTPKQPTLYAYSTDDNELNKRFYQRYDENFVYNKALALACILEEQEKFKLLAAEFRDVDPSRINDKFFETLRAELHFTEMHQFEGFFALLIAIFKDLPHWIYLTAYHTAEIANAIHQFIKGDIQTLTDGVAKNDREFVSMAVYATYAPQEEMAKEDWEKNLDNIAWLIRHMAEKYVASRDEYNSYKHGLRVMTGESSFNLGLNNSAGQPGPLRTVAHSLDAFYYLELVEGVIQIFQDPESKQKAEVFKSKKEKAEEEKSGEVKDERIIEEVEVIKPYEMMKFFNPKQSLAHLSLMNRLLATIKNTRLAYYTDKGQLGPLMTLFDLDRDEIIALREKFFEFRISI